MDVMVYEVSRHFWKLAVSAGSVLVFCYASLMPVSLAVAFESRISWMVTTLRFCHIAAL